MIAGLTEQELQALLLSALGRVLDDEFAPLIARLERMEAEDAATATDARPDAQ